MASLQDLPADQRAVLQLVLQRGRSYDDIAALLSIDREAVRQRALSALEALGPQTAVPAERRALITDYLLGQLPRRLDDDTRDSLAESPPERAWARVVAAALSTIATTPLPEIPVESRRESTAPPAPTASASPPVAAEPTPPYAQPPDQSGGGPPHPEPALQPLGSGAPETAGAGAATSAPPAASPPTMPPRSEAEGTSGPSTERRSSRLGGAILLALALVVIVVAIILITSGGSSNSSSTSASRPASTPAASSSASSSGTQVVGQINLTPPGGRSKAAGIAEILKQGSVNAIAIVAQHLAANTKHDAYAVWLYNSPTDSRILGFVNPPVSSNGTLRTEGQLPTNAAHYKQLVISLETQAKPQSPGQIVLQGALNLT